MEGLYCGKGVGHGVFGGTPSVVCHSARIALECQLGRGTADLSGAQLYEQ
jgi:hypothetical protein